MNEKTLNRICLDCPHLDTHCDGSHEDIYSGCIWKTATAEDLDSFNQQIKGIIREEAEK